jgi:branched-chain amino acid transport system permease protein
MVFMVIIGGIGTMEGPVVGAIVFYTLQNQLDSLGSWYLVILGLVAIVITLLAPRGIWGWISRDGRFEIFPIGHTVVEGRSST